MAHKRQPSAKVEFASLRRPENTSAIQENTTEDQFLDLAGDYLEDKRIWDLFKGLAERAAIEQPSDPISFFIDELKRPRNPLRILLLGPPGSGKSTLCEYIVSNYKIQRISTGALLRAEIDKQSPSGIRAKQFVDKGQIVPDDIMFPLIKTGVSSEKSKTNGWIIEGYPLTRSQGNELLRLGILPNKILLLELDHESALKRIVGRRVDPTNGEIYAVDDNQIVDQVKTRLRARAQDSPEIAKNTLESYSRNINGVIDLFKGSIYVIDAKLPKSQLTNRIDTVLQERKRSDAPTRPPRVICLGPVGSGRTTQSRALAKELGLIHISPGELLREQIGKGSEVGKLAKMYVSQGKMAPDDLVNSIVKDKVLSRESKEKGFILDGYPGNAAQIEAMKSWKVNARRCIVLDAADATLVKRVCGRRVDPLTNNIYHVDYDPPPAGDIADRCIQRPEDKEDVVGTLIARYRHQANTLKHHFKPVSTMINAELDMRTVYDRMKYFICTPLPMKRSQ